MEDVNDLLNELKVQIRSLKDQLKEVEKYEQMIKEANGTKKQRDDVKVGR